MTNSLFADNQTNMAEREMKIITASMLCGSNLLSSGEFIHHFFFLQNKLKIKQLR